MSDSAQERRPKAISTSSSFLFSRHRPYLFWVLFFLAAPCAPAQQARTTASINQSDGSDYSLVVQAGHGSDLQQIVIDHRGQQMATMAMDAGVKVWNIPRKQEIWSFSGRQGPNSSYSPMVFSPDDSILALAQGNIIHFFSLATGEVKDLTVPSPMPTCIAFSDDGNQVAVGGLFGRIDLLRISDGSSKVLYDPTLPAVQEIQGMVSSGQIFNFVWSLFFLDSAHKLVSGSTKGAINTFDLGDSARNPKDPPPSSVLVDGMVRAFGVSKGELIAIGTDTTLNSVRIWRVATQEVLVDRADCHTEMNLPNFAISSHGDLAAASCMDAQVRHPTYELWSLPSAVAVAIPQVIQGMNIQSPTAISADGTVFAISDNNQQLKVLDLKSGLPPMQMEESPIHSVESIQAVAKTHELAICTRTQTAIWKNNRTTAVQTLYSNSGPYTLSTDGKWMAYFDDAYKLRIVDRENRKEASNPISEENAAEYARHNAGFYNFRMAVSSDGPTIFWMEGGGFNGYAKFWRTGDRTEHILCDTTFRGELAVSPSGNYVAIGCNRGPIGSPQSAQVLLFRVKDMGLIDEAYGDMRDGKPSTITGLAFTPDETHYLLAMGGEIQIRSTEGKEPLPSIHSDLSTGKIYMGPIAVSPDGRFIVTQSALFTFPALNFSQQMEVLNFEGHSLKQAQLATLCKSVEFASNLIAIGLQDGTTTLYTVPDLQPRVTLVHPDGWVAVSPSGMFDGNAEALHWIGWRRRDQRVIIPLDLLYDNYYRPDLVNDIINNKYAPPPRRLSNELGLGSLEFMMEQGYAYIEPAQGATYLCFSTPPQGLDLYSDGAPISFAASQIDPGASATCPWRVKLPAGEAKIESGKKRPTNSSHCPAVLKPPTSEQNGRGTLHVLTVSVSVYGPETGYPALPSAVPSAVALERLFASQPKGSDHPFRDIVVERGLRNGEISPTLANIRTSWTKMAESSKPEDTALLFLSGHGLVPLGTEMFYFAPLGFDPTSLSTIRNTGLNVAMLADMLRALPARRVVIVIDACQSGAALTSLAKIADMKSKIEMARDRSGPVGIYVLASATALQDATARPEGGVGFVVEAILESAGEQANRARRQVSAGRMLDRICTNLLDRTAQTPLIHSSGSNFSLIEEKY
jgi:WD40 repeat protein